MFYCKRCRNTGKVQEQYADFQEATAPVLLADVLVEAVPIRVREVECPECLGFGGAGWALPGGSC